MEIVEYLITPHEFELLNLKYLRWVEIFFTRNTISSNMVSSQSMRNSLNWAAEDWRGTSFQIFVEILSTELNRLFEACGIQRILWQTFFIVVRVVTQLGSWNVQNMDFKGMKVSRIFFMGILFLEAGSDFVTHGRFDDSRAIPWQELTWKHWRV